MIHEVRQSRLFFAGFCFGFCFENDLKSMGKRSGVKSFVLAIFGMIGVGKLILVSTLSCIYIKGTKSAGYSYIQLAESFRDESGKPRQRMLSTLVRVDETGGEVDSILNALLRAKGRRVA